MAHKWKSDLAKLISLTPSETEVYALYQNFSSRQIAEKIGIKSGSVRACIRGIEKKAKAAKVELEYVDSAGNPVIIENLEPHEEHLLKKQLRVTKKQRQALLEQRSQDTRLADILEKIYDLDTESPKWIVPKRKPRGDKAIATAFLSDTHFDEVVDPSQINFVNAYNREIATIRLEKFFHNTIRLGRDHFGGIEIQGLVLALGGDMVSGNIHDELAETNDDYILPTILYWTEQLRAGITLLLEQYPKIHIPCVTGNHGRQYRKPRAKFRAETNYDWMIYRLLQRDFAKVREVTFDIPSGTEARWSVYDTKFQMTHGDQFKYGGGIGGISVPLLRGDAKKRQTESATNSPYDILLLGHFHQLLDLATILVNGSLKGYDEYAASVNCPYEDPRQAYFLCDPRHGKTISAPIRVKSDKENWGLVDPMEGTSTNHIF